MKTALHALIGLLCMLLIFTNVAAQKKKTPASKPVATTSTDNDQIKNGIQLNCKGFKVAEAYLVFDDQTSVPANNKVALNENVNMLLIIDSGWTEIGDRVYPGSKQVLKLPNGKELLNSEELFAAFDETGVAKADAHYITLNTVVTDFKEKNKYVTVNFRLWDKKGSSEINGSYKLFVK